VNDSDDNKRTDIAFSTLHSKVDVTRLHYISLHRVGRKVNAVIVIQNDGHCFVACFGKLLYFSSFLPVVESIR